MMHDLFSICLNNRIPEAVLIVMVTTVCVFSAVTLLGTCIREKKDSKEEMRCPGLTVRQYYNPSKCASNFLPHSGWCQFYECDSQLLLSWAWHCDWLFNQLLQWHGYSDVQLPRDGHQSAVPPERYVGMWCILSLCCRCMFIISRCLLTTHSLDFLPNLLLHFLLDIRCWYLWWCLYPFSFNWSSLWEIHGNYFWVISTMFTCMFHNIIVWLQLPPSVATI